MGPGEEPRRYEAATGSLEEICRSADDLGIRVCLENLFSDENHLVFCDTLPKLLHLVRSVDDPRPGICVDTSHGNIMGHVWEDIEICGDAVQRTHISDNFGSHDDHLPPGDGEIPWDAVLTSLHRVSYPGPLTLEVGGAGDPEGRITKARDQLAGIISEWKP
jgi:sugar phosphate isomerase/epimerase